MSQQTDLLETPGLIVDATASKQLREAAGWSKLLAVMVFLFGIMSILAAFAVGFAFTGAALLLYLGGATLLFLMAYHLFYFSGKIKKSIHENSQEGLTAAYKNLKYYFLVAGITAMVTVVFGVLAFLFAATFGR